MKNISKYVPVVIIVLAAAFLAGCAAQKDLEAMQDQARRDRVEHRESYKELEAELAKKIEETSNPVQARQADIWAELASLKQDIAAISGRMDDVEMKMDDLSGKGTTASLPQVAADVHAIKFALEHQLAVDMEEVMRLAAPTMPKHSTAVMGLTPEAEAQENTGVILTQEVVNPDGTVSTIEVGAPAAKSVQDGTAQAAEAVQDTAQAATEAAQAVPQALDTTQAATQGAADPAQLLYDKAYENFGARGYDKARSLWAEFTTTFTDHALVPNAIFWQGECWYQLGDYQRAILAYQDVIKKHPKSTKYKYALLKQGISFYRLSKKDLGKLVLGDLVSKYPDSTEAARAKQFMKAN